MSTKFLKYFKNQKKSLLYLFFLFIVFLAFLLTMVFPSGNVIFANGSTTVLPLLENLGYKYFNDTNETKIGVSGGGSTVGINFIMNKLTNIGNASRNPEDVEYKTSTWKNNQLSTFPIAYDGIIFGVNAKGVNISPNDVFTIDVLYKLFSGKAKTWKDVFPDCNPVPVYLISRENGSGTRDSFYNAMKAYGHPDMKLPDSKNLSISNSNGLSLSILSMMKGSIAYLPLSYINIIKSNYNFIDLPKIKYNTQSTDVIDPNSKNVSDDIFKNGVLHPNDPNYYLFWHPLNLIISLEDAKKKYLFDFLNWILGPKGKSIVDDQKYINIYCSDQKCGGHSNEIVIVNKIGDSYLSFDRYMKTFIEVSDYNKQIQPYWWNN
ncbi:substrate-binding domain-containing protein [Mycoplasma sp. SG1]|uniref:substrate-binding domain-containing protein n=1 Tax=Mycoplasma sp. SG1 TaxID=2810348 RepID=UPI00202534A0|nr:substrate-binding domain-containing protein [Mycoplasma sp. SG1]URM52781.1 substrate-binding domain-containing protein [Mycoplasma sp. SG1]